MARIAPAGYPQIVSVPLSVLTFVLPLPLIGLRLTTAFSGCLDPAAKPVVAKIPLKADFLSLIFFLSSENVASVIFTRLVGDSFFLTFEVTRRATLSPGLTQLVGAIRLIWTPPTVVVATVFGVPALPLVSTNGTS